jgi:hypothetical protein
MMSRPQFRWSTRVGFCRLYCQVERAALAMCNAARSPGRERISSGWRGTHGTLCSLAKRMRHL